MVRDDAESLVSEAPVDAPDDSVEVDDDGKLADLAAAVDRREQELPADRAYRPRWWRGLASLFFLLLTLVLGLLAGNFVGLAILSFAYGDISIALESSRGRHMIGGSVGEMIIGVTFAVLASSANRLRKRLRRRPGTSHA